MVLAATEQAAAIRCGHTWTNVLNQTGPAKAALAMDVFGKAGMDMVPLLNQGADGLENLHDIAHSS
jgi:hypothetical protein